MLKFPLLDELTEGSDLGGGAPPVETPQAEPSLRDALTAALDGAEKPLDEKPAVERPRDEQGRFAPKTAEEQAAAQTEGEARRKEAQQPKLDPAKAQVEAAKPATEGFKPPRAWKAEAVAEWNKLPPQVQAEVHRREADVQRVMQEGATHKRIVQELGELVTPYQQNITASGMQPVQFLGQVLEADNMLRHGNVRTKAQVIANLIGTYGVDVAALDDILSSGQTNTPARDPQLDLRRQIMQELRQELQPVLTTFQSLTEQQQQARATMEAQANAEVEAIAAKPHFDTVREDMADLLDASARRGVALTLEQAYDKAMLLHPELRVQQQAHQRHEQAQRARKAAASIGGGAPAGMGAPAHRSTGTLRDDVAAAWEAAQNSV